jgi:hypothetical protein
MAMCRRDPKGRDDPGSAARFNQPLRYRAPDFSIASQVLGRPPSAQQRTSSSNGLTSAFFTG